MNNCATVIVITEGPTEQKFVTMMLFPYMGTERLPGPNYSAQTRHSHASNKTFSALPVPLDWRAVLRVFGCRFPPEEEHKA